MASSDVGIFWRLFFYDYCASMLWLKGEGGRVGTRGPLSQAYFFFFYYCALVVMGIMILVNNFIKIAIGINIPFKNFGALITCLLILVTYYLSAVYMRSKSALAISLFSEYRKISYLKNVVFGALLLCPLPLFLAIAIAAEKSYLIVFVLVAHWFYLTTVGGYFLRKIKI